MPQNEVQPLHSIFGAASMNDHTHSHLWVDGAAQFIPRLNDLLAHQDHLFQILHMDTFHNPQQDVLGKILEHHHSDKSTTHNYNILYSYILGPKRDQELNVLEVGLGTNNPDLVSSMGSEGTPGASLYSFRDYLPSSKVYGADIDRNILFQSERISTAYVDQMNPASFTEMFDSFGNPEFDLIIDDGLHSIGANLNTLVFTLKHLKKDGWLVVEDIHRPDNWRAIDFIVRQDPRYESFMVKAGNGYYYQNQSYMYVVHRI